MEFGKEYSRCFIDLKMFDPKAATVSRVYRNNLKDAVVLRVHRNNLTQWTSEKVRKRQS